MLHIQTNTLILKYHMVQKVVSDNVKIIFNLDVGLSDKTRNMVENSSFNDLKIAVRTSLLH